MNWTIVQHLVTCQYDLPSEIDLNEEWCWGDALIWVMHLRG